MLKFREILIGHFHRVIRELWRVLGGQSSRVPFSRATSQRLRLEFHYFRSYLNETSRLNT